MSEILPAPETEQETWIKTQWEAFSKVAQENKQYVESLSVRQYIDATVLPVLTEGLATLVKQRPSNPVEFLGQYLIDHDPAKIVQKEEPSDALQSE